MEMVSAKPSEQLAEINGELLASLGRLNKLIDNRGAWGDAIEGCREAVTLLRSLQGRLHDTLEATHEVESALVSSRDEVARWSQMYADLQAVERQIRAERNQLQEANAGLTAAESELRTQLDKRKALLDKQSTSLANVRALALEMVRDIGS